MEKCIVHVNCQMLRESRVADESTCTHVDGPAMQQLLWPHLSALCARLEAKGTARMVANQGFAHALHELPKDLSLGACNRVGCVQHKGILCWHHLQAACLYSMHDAQLSRRRQKLSQMV